jgi:2-phospho-L-lactate guanylyltransferase
VVDPGPEAYRVTAVVPVKGLDRAKSRLALPAGQRRALALAFTDDTLAALTACPLVGAVVVVTTDPVVASRAGRYAVRVVPDDTSGLDAAVRTGAHVAAAERPGDGVLVVPADLPCLRPVDVTEVLVRAQALQAAFVPDRPGNGTTMVTLPPGRPTVTRYGPGSAAGHLALGLTALSDAPERARHDVDTLEDLCGARALGLGPRTAEVVAALDGTGQVDAEGAQGTRRAVLGRPSAVTPRRWRPTP